MLFSANTNPSARQTTEAGRTRTDDDVRPAVTTDAGKIRLGGGFRLPATTVDAGKIRLGGGFRLPVMNR